MLEPAEVASSLRSLDAVLDGWRQVRATKKQSQIAIKEENDEETGAVESLGKGMAALIPHKSANDNGWQVSSEEESEEEVMDTHVPPPVKGIVFHYFTSMGQESNYFDISIEHPL